MPHVHESDSGGVVGSGGDGHLLKHLIAPWTLGAESLWVGLTTLAPGVSTQPSSLTGIESAHVTIDGSGREIVGDETIATRAGSFVFIPKGVLHSVANTGDTPLRVVTIATPPIARPE